jgi:hypothetical protein
MGILDEAIREHLELKRQHGADDSELKQLEDQAFGPPERPGAEAAAAEAPTEFMAQPEGEAAPARREPAAGLADIQEAPEKAEEPEPQQAPEEQPAPEEQAAAEEEPVAEAQPAAEQEPVAEEQPAAEHEAIPSPGGHSTEERHAIADQPTQMYDVEEEFAGTDAAAPPDEDLVAEEMTEARLVPPEPVPAVPQVPDDDEDDDFFDEQRLSDELDQALEAPLETEPEPASDQHESPPPETAESDEDVLEETPDFLEETPEDDQLWFEQKPPKDFDFDD